MIQYRKEEAGNRGQTAEAHEDIRERLEAIAVEDRAMKQAFEQWEEASQSAENWLAYEQRRKVVLDEMMKVKKKTYEKWHNG